MDKLNLYNYPGSQKHSSIPLINSITNRVTKREMFAGGKQPLSYVQTTLTVGTRSIDKFAMLDTGANIEGLLCLSTVRALNTEIDTLESDKVKGVQGATIRMMGTAMVDVKIGSLTQTLSLFIPAEKMNFDFILGLNVLKEFNLNYQTLTLELPHCKEQVPMIIPTRHPVEIVASVTRTQDAGDPLTPMSRSVHHEYLLTPETSGGTIEIPGLSHVSVMAMMNSTDLPYEALTPEKPSRVKQVTFGISFCKSNGDTFTLAMPTVNNDHFTSIIEEYKDLFATDNDQLGEIPDEELSIDTYDDYPISVPIRKYRPNAMEAIAEQIQEWLANGIIVPSDSPYSAALVAVRQKMKTRICCDFRALNENTKPVSKTLPLMQHLIDSIAGKRFYTVLDIKQAYHCLRLSAKDQHKTAFATPRGDKYHFTRVPFGLKGAPGKWSSIMLRRLRKFPAVYVYLDDIIISNDTIESHVEDLKGVFEELRKLNIRVAPSKAKIGRSSVVYLGYVVSVNGTRIDPEKVADLSTKQPPSSYQELMSALACFNVYRHYVLNYAHKVEPLQALLREREEDKKWRKEQNKIRKEQGKQPLLVCRKGSSLKKTLPKFADVWLDNHSRIFREVRNELCENTSLSKPDYTQPFWIACDANQHAWGAVLFQYGKNGLKQPIRFSSGNFNSAQQRYSATERELSAIVNSVEKYRHYFAESNIINVVTDHNALRYLNGLASRKNDRLFKWSMSLSEYQMNIVHLAGKYHSDADYMSRWDSIPFKTGPSITESFELKSTDMTNVCTLVSAPETLDNQERQMHHSINALFNATEVSSFKLRAKDVAQLEKEPSLSFRAVVKREQRKDMLCIALKKNVLDDPDAAPVPLNLQKELGTFHIGSSGILTKAIWYQTKRKGQVTVATVLPLNLVNQVLQTYHDHNYHMGFTHCHSTIRARYYWPGMYADISKYVLSCKSCQMRKTGKTIPQAQGKVVTATRPFQVIAVDFVSIEQGSHGKQKAHCVLTITDLFTRYVNLVPCVDQRAETYIEALMARWIPTFGWPRAILSDNGAAFTAQTTRNFFDRAGVDLKFITPGNPKGNSVAERINRPLLDMVSATLHAPGQPRAHWIAQLPWIQLTLNNRQMAILQGFTPMEALFGVQYALKSDIEQNLDEAVPTVEGRLEALQQIRDQLPNRPHILTPKADLLDRPQFHVGEKVLWKRNTTGLPKTAPKYDGPHEVISAIPNFHGGHTAYVILRNGRNESVHVGRLKRYRERV